MNYLIYVRPVYNSSVGKESACNAEDHGSIPWLGRSPREGKGYPLQYSCLENSMDCIGHGVDKIPTQLSNFYFRFHFHFQSLYNRVQHRGSGSYNNANPVFTSIRWFVLPLVLLSPPPHPSKPWALSERRAME